MRMTAIALTGFDGSNTKSVRISQNPKSNNEPWYRNDGWCP
jgi:hypothetical protein